MWRRVVLLLASALTGCFSYDACNTDLACARPCEGQCAPYLGGGWSFVLVARSSGTTRREACPDAAPFETMSTLSPPMTACGVQEAEGTCASAGEACLPDEPDWQACVVRDGAHACPAPYGAQVETEDSSITLCCPGEMG